MQSATQLVLPCEILSAGVDWITATAKTGGSKYDMGVLAGNILRRAMDAGETPKAGRRQGYDGYGTNHFFHGEKHGSAMMIASSSAADDLWRSISEVCDNVSRLDLQVTVYTILERPHVAKVIHDQIKRGEHGQIPVRNSTYIEGHPDGETVNLNKRSSDCSARVYDKAAESSLGLSRTVWRYEVECRRRVAKSALATLRSNHHPHAATIGMVYSWFDKRGVQPLFNTGQTSNAFAISAGKIKGDTMAWFRETLSKTVASQVRLHGRAAVLNALGLSEDHLSRPEEV